jgi:hypothetical protein
MPLFMDYHKFENVSIDAVKSAHTADETVQDEYGVKYLQFWVNENEGSVFCLVEGPDKQTCEKVHQLAHGNLACALTEVEPVLYRHLMGTDHKIESGHVRHADGRTDPGTRIILVVSNYGSSKAEEAVCISRQFMARTKQLFAETLDEFSGRPLQAKSNHPFVGVFDEAEAAVNGAIALLAKANSFKSPEEVSLRIGLSASQPVTINGDFFSEAILLAERLSFIARDRIVVSSQLGEIWADERLVNRNELRMLTIQEEELLTRLMNVAEQRVSDPDFEPDDLGVAICMSRPQLYRKIKALTGLSPNEFINDTRLNKAFEFIRDKRSSIATIAFETGFNSASYFTKCFTGKFGITPSALLRNITD